MLGIRFVLDKIRRIRRHIQSVLYILRLGTMLEEGWEGEGRERTERNRKRWTNHGRTQNLNVVIASHQRHAVQPI